VARFATAVVGVIELLLTGLLAFYATDNWLERTARPFLGSKVADSLVFGLATLVMAVVIVNLLKGKKWSWWVSLLGSCVFLCLGLLMLWLTLNPRDAFARSEGGFGVFVTGLLLFPSLLSVVLLNLPTTRRRFRLFTSK
jgi:hypothetical protein